MCTLTVVCHYNNKKLKATLFSDIHTLIHPSNHPSSHSSIHPSIHLSIHHPFTHPSSHGNANANGSSFVLISIKLIDTLHYRTPRLFHYHRPIRNGAEGGKTTPLPICIIDYREICRSTTYRWVYDIMYCVTTKHITKICWICFLFLLLIVVCSNYKYVCVNIWLT